MKTSMKIHIEMTMKIHIVATKRKSNWQIFMQNAAFFFFGLKSMHTMIVLQSQTAHRMIQMQKPCEYFH